jgi:hypothetical protein
MSRGTVVPDILPDMQTALESEGRATRMVPSSRDRTRTCDPLINSQLLYQLSYSGKTPPTARRVKVAVRIPSGQESAMANARATPCYPAGTESPDPEVSRMHPRSPRPLLPTSVTFGDGKLPQRCH